MSYLSAPVKFCLFLIPAVGLFFTGTEARASERLALSFELPPAHSAPSESEPQPLVRYQESLPPIESGEVPTETVVPVAVETVELPAVNVVESAPLPAPSSGDKIGLQFAANEIEMPLAAAIEETNAIAASLVENHQAVEENANASGAAALDDWIFDGGSDSLVARTVGSAEGTRRSDGERTTAYYGHVDPGNGVWNQGTFSYQHEASSPEEADKKQLQRLKRQELQIKEKAAHWQIPLSTEVRLNGLDLANQAPLAALDKGGYIERLAEAYQYGKSGEQAIVWARTHAYFDPDKQAWDAPGLGNNRYSIQRDQERRMAAIKQAMVAYDNEFVNQIADLQDVHVEGVAVASSRLSGQSGATASASFSDRAVSFDYAKPDPAEPVYAESADSALPAESIAFDLDSLSRELSDEGAAIANASAADTAAAEEVAVENAENATAVENASVEGTLAFEPDRVEIDEWTPARETAASEGLAVTEDLAVMEDGAIDVDSVDLGGAIAIDPIAVEPGSVEPGSVEPGSVEPATEPAPENAATTLTPAAAESASDEDSSTEASQLERLASGVLKPDVASEQIRQSAGVGGSAVQAASQSELALPAPLTAEKQATPEKAAVEIAETVPDSSTKASTDAIAGTNKPEAKSQRRRLWRTEDTIVQPEATRREATREK